MEFIDKLKNVFKENDIEVINFTGEKDSIQFKCNTCGTIYEQKSARNLLSRITLCKKCYNPFERWNEDRLMKYKFKRIYPYSKLEILDYKNMKDGATVKCLKCGAIEKVNNLGALFAGRKDYFCNSCEKEKDIIQTHLNEELKQGFLTLIEWNGANGKSKFQCNRCKHIFEKRVTTHFDGRICPNCFQTYNKFDFQQGEELLLQKAGPDYQLLQFKGTDSRSLVKHKCGFCYTVRIEDFNKTKGCPKCFKKFSQLEQTVASF